MSKGVVTTSIPTTVLLVGKGGMGKARFLIEVEAALRRQYTNVTVSYGRALAQHPESNGFQPIREVLSDLVFEAQCEKRERLVRHIFRSILLSAATKTITNIHQPERKVTLNDSLTRQFCRLVEDLLDREHVTQLISEVVGRLPLPVLVERLMSITAGNPLFLHKYVGLLPSRLNLTSVTRLKLIYVRHLYLCRSGPVSNSRSVKDYRFCGTRLTPYTHQRTATQLPRPKHPRTWQEAVSRASMASSEHPTPRCSSCGDLLVRGL